MGFNPANVIILRISAIFRIFAVLFATACVSCKCLPFPGIFLCGKLFASAGNVLNSLPNPRKHEGTPNPLKGALPLAQRGLTLLPKGVLPFCPKGSYPFAQRGLTLLPKRGLTLLPKRGLTLLPKRGLTLLPKGVLPFCLKASSQDRGWSTRSRGDASCPSPLLDNPDAHDGVLELGSGDEGFVAHTGAVVVNGGQRIV